MKYVGSKNRLSKDLVPIVQKYIDDNRVENYMENFVGGANIIDKINCKNRYGSDIHKYLIALLKQAQRDTSVFPNTITEEEYHKVKDNKEEYPDWYVGLVGFCASYNSKWFGGYANNVTTKIGTVRNYTDEAIKNIVKQAPNLKDIHFKCCDFREINRNIKNYVIYEDIPYKNTTKYATEEFPYEEFYNWCREMSKNNIVLISEYWMPDDFECIWSKDLICTLDKNSRTNKTERLWKYGKGINSL